jgi:hypothetical protein
MGNELYTGLKTCFEFYNFKHPHQGIDYKSCNCLWKKFMGKFVILTKRYNFVVKKRFVNSTSRGERGYLPLFRKIKS